ncbi:MAG: UDPGP type 1 family protein [Sedimentisphaerales bacterium]|nr:UDPGP type 1 family protein [Sedimentisphaerales bacterium]
MSNLEIYKKTLQILKKHNQEQILSFWDELNSDQKDRLIGQIELLDFSKIKEWIENFVRNTPSALINTDFEPVSYYKSEPENSGLQGKYVNALELGKKLISQGKVAAFVVAGGQGTRLGFDGPKGNFPISPIRKKTLFQIFAENISATSSKYKTTCPWYIMTSPLNHEQTVEIFQSNNYYGLEKDNIFIFQQGTLPNFSTEGKILLAEKGEIACSPDGHGGCIEALYKSGAIEDMKNRGIEYISYWQVDNPLINIFDPLFIGLHALDEAEMSSKALIKTGPKEKLGNFCLVDGKVNIIEYSDLPDELAIKRNSDNALVFELGSIAIHIINRNFLEKFASKSVSLPLHRAVKNITHIDQNGHKTESQGIKLESFIFDAVPLASNSIVLETIRSEEFAPVKNATGVDSAKSAHQMMIDRAAKWLEYSGIEVPRKTDGSVDCTIEIAPSFALEKDDLKEKLPQIPPIKLKGTIYLE